MTLTPSQSSESMQSNHSVAPAGGACPAGAAPRPTASSINRSLTSLNSVDSAPMEVIDELQPTDAKLTEASDAEGSPPLTAAEVKTEKLISFSPTNTPTHEAKPTPNTDLDTTKERPRSVSECHTASTEKHRSREVDDVSQTSIVGEDDTSSLTSAKEEPEK